MSEKEKPGAGGGETESRYPKEGGTEMSKETHTHTHKRKQKLKAEQCEIPRCSGERGGRDRKAETYEDHLAKEILEKQNRRPLTALTNQGRLHGRDVHADP